MSVHPTSNKCFKRKLQRRNREVYLKLRSNLLQRVTDLEHHLEIRERVAMISWKDIAQELQMEVASLTVMNQTLRTQVKQYATILGALSSVIETECISGINEDQVASQCTAELIGVMCEYATGLVDVQLA
ncbi:hypothetical protein THRCLA_22835 [Thraustotheca clavata]|uniref:Uncharacterized protein n=1 Tax=Thraustotheca clavata TaxID=74557 RepID=A0A1V9YSN2_9STRA|nr:hypothetical protein THRCLA_22835 [Thraustotheca clavata]